MRRVLWLILWVGITPTTASAQGLPFHTPSALTTAFEQRGVRAFTMVLGRGNVTAVATPLVLLPWAPHQRVTTIVSVPYLWKRLDPAPMAPGGRYTNQGLGDVGVSVKWAFFKRDRFAGTSRVALIASARLPTGSSDARIGGEVAPRGLQLGGGSPGFGATVAGTWIRNRWALSSALGRSASSADGEFRAGAVTRYDVAVGLRFPAYVETIRTRTLQLYLEWNGQVVARSRSGGQAVGDTGGHVAYVSPGLQWVVVPRLLLEASVQLPVVQDLNGVQPRFGVRPAVGIRYLFF